MICFSHFFFSGFLAHVSAHKMLVSTFKSCSLSIELEEHLVNQVLKVEDGRFAIMISISTMKIIFIIHKIRLQKIPELPQLSRVDLCYEDNIYYSQNKIVKDSRASSTFKSSNMQNPSFQGYKLKQT